MISAYSSPTGHETLDNNQNLLHRPSPSDQRCPVPTPPKKDRRTPDSLTGITAGEEGRNGGGSDAAEAENKEADDDDEDGIAPSDSAIILDDNQAGHTPKERAASLRAPGQKRKRSIALEGEASNAAEVKAEKRIRTVDEIEEWSDADDYAGVDTISDFDEVDRSVEEIEEMMIIASEENTLDNRNYPLSHFSHRLGRINHNGDPCLFESEEQNSPFNPHTPPHEGEYYYSSNSVRDQTPPLRVSDGRRRVHFAEPVNDIFSEDLSEFLPEMLSSPSTREDERSGTPRGKIAEGGEDKRKCAPKTSRTSRVESQTRHVWSNSCNGSLEGSSGSSSGYESEGETTEEDEILRARSQSLLRRPLGSSLRHERSQAPMPLHRPSQKGKRLGPPMGSWIADPTKPIVLFDKTGSSLLVFGPLQDAKTNKKTPHQMAGCKSAVDTTSRKSRLSFPSDHSWSPDCSDLDLSDLDSLEGWDPNAPFEKPSVISSGLLHENPKFPPSHYRLIEQVTEPPPLFLQPMGINPEFFLTQDNESNDHEGDDIPLNIRDFIEFSDDSEDGTDDKESSATIMSDQTPSGLMAAQHPPTTTQPSHDFLNYLGDEIAAAFHRDQHLPATQLPSFFEDDTLDSSIVDSFDSVEDGSDAPASASLCPEIWPSKKRRLSDGLNRAESVSQARAALAAMI